MSSSEQRGQTNEMRNSYRCQLIISDESDEERAARERREAARTDIPPGALELAQSFRVFHKLMVTSREIFKKANANIALFAEQQNIIHHVNVHSLISSLILASLVRRDVVIKNCTLPLLCSLSPANYECIFNCMRQETILNIPNWPYR